jgi:hypothetical protein
MAAPSLRTFLSMMYSVTRTHTVVTRRTHRNIGTSTTLSPMKAHATLPTKSVEASRDLGKRKRQSKALHCRPHWQMMPFLYVDTITGMMTQG